MAVARMPGQYRYMRVHDPKKKSNIVLEIPSITKKSSKSRSFHFRYLELCRAKNIPPVVDVRSKSSATTYLELYGDKLGVNEWQLITESLNFDMVLQTIILRMRRINGNNTIESIDTEKRARIFRQRPVIYTRYIFGSLVDSIANCIKNNNNLTVLKLEGLPLQDKYIETIAKALANNESLKELSFHKSGIGDKGCEALCNTVKYLNNVGKFDVSDCNIAVKGAECVTDMIKMQKITRFTEGWEKSLRYRDVDETDITGLYHLSLANNPGIGDEGVKLISEMLKEDQWLKFVDMENCGITDRGANMVLDCLDLNCTLKEFNVRQNDGISKPLLRSICDRLGKEDEQAVQEPEYDLNGVDGLQSLPKNKKYTVSQLLGHAKMLEDQLSFERVLRKKAEKLNEKLSQQLMILGEHMNMDRENNVKAAPSGYVVLRRDGSFESLIRGENLRTTPVECTPVVDSTTTTNSPSTTPRSSNLATLRKEDEVQQPLTLDEEMIETCITENENTRLLAVRKVRSEIKYVEAKMKDNAKKHESKSDHEFANEMHFKLNADVQFERDIGDTVQLNNPKKYHNMGGGDGGVSGRRETNNTRTYEQAGGDGYPYQMHDREYVGDDVNMQHYEQHINIRHESINMSFDECNYEKVSRAPGTNSQMAAARNLSFDNISDSKAHSAPASSVIYKPTESFTRRTSKSARMPHEDASTDEDDEEGLSPRSQYMKFHRK